MYVIKRNSYFWLCESAMEAFEVDAVQIRLQCEDKDFEVFQQRLAKGECVKASVIQVYKCNDTNRCEDCMKYTKCEIRLSVQETAETHAEWVKWVESKGGYTF